MDHCIYIQSLSKFIYITKILRNIYLRRDISKNYIFLIYLYDTFNIENRLKTEREGKEREKEEEAGEQFDTIIYNRNE